MADLLANNDQLLREFNFKDQIYTYYLAEDAEGLSLALENLARLNGDFNNFILFVISGRDPANPYEALIMVTRENDKYTFWHRNLLDRPALKEKVVATIDHFLGEQATHQTVSECFHDLYNDKGGRGELLRSITDPRFFSSENAMTMMSTVLLPRDETLAQSFEMLAKKIPTKKMPIASQISASRISFFSPSQQTITDATPAAETDMTIKPGTKTPS